jgi:hypothetical protein
MKQAMNLIYIAMTISAIGFIVYANYMSSNQHKKKVECTEKPISQPVDTIRIESEHMIYHEWDSYMDSVDWDCGDYYDSDEYMELWYTRIDTNSNGEPDNIEGLY